MKIIKTKNKGYEFKYELKNVYEDVHMNIKRYVYYMYINHMKRFIKYFKSYELKNLNMNGIIKFM